MCLLLTVGIWALTGCAPPTRPSPPPIPESFLEPCPELAFLTSAEPQAVLQALVEIVTEYGLCRGRHEDLIDAVRRRQE